MNERVEQIIDMIAQGAGGSELFEALCWLQSDTEVAVAFRSEVKLRSQVASAGRPVVIDPFTVDALYGGRLTGLIALQVSAALLSDEKHWDIFMAIHQAEQFARDYDTDDDTEALHEETIEYGELIDIAEISATPSSQQLLTRQPGGEQNLVLHDDRSTYLSDSDVQPAERLIFSATRYQVSILWQPAVRDLRFSVSPPQCKERVFMRSPILLRMEGREHEPNRRDYSSIVANALFARVEDPWGSTLSVSRKILPGL